MRTAAVGVMIVFMAMAAGAAEPAPLRIYLPRSVQVDGERLQLGTLGVILCTEAGVARKARAIAMGRAPWPKEKMLIDRATVLSRLAGNGIPKGRVRITGAAAVTVTRDEKLLPSDRLLRAAEEFLKKPPGQQDCIYRVVRKPQDLVVPGPDDLELSCKLAKTAADGQVKVVVTIRRDGKQLGLREAWFKRLYPVHRAVAAATIPAGSALTRQNVQIQTIYCDRPPAAGWQAPYGRLAARTLRRGTIIAPALTSPKRPDLQIRRNQMVRMRVQGPGFVITGVGQALQAGRPGDSIKVRNVDSRRVITARIAFDGSVEPVFKR